MKTLLVPNVDDFDHLDQMIMLFSKEEAVDSLLD